MFYYLLRSWRLIFGGAIEISSEGVYPADVLSNMCSNSFEFEGVHCMGMESFLQSLKERDEASQRAMCGMRGRIARKESNRLWVREGKLWWRGCEMARESEAYAALVTAAFDAMFAQSERFRTALAASKNRKLYYKNCENDPRKTILTEKEFCGQLVRLRRRLR